MTICKHDRLARSCETCLLEQEVGILQERLDRVAAIVDVIEQHGDLDVTTLTQLRQALSWVPDDLPSEPTVTQLTDEQGYHEWVLGGLINATNEIQQLRLTFSSRGVFNALRYYQKQGLCEGNEYEEIENALEALSTTTEPCVCESIKCECGYHEPTGAERVRYAYTCPNCENLIEPEDASKAGMRCPTCRVKEIVPLTIGINAAKGDGNDA